MEAQPTTIPYPFQGRSAFDWGLFSIVLTIGTIFAIFIFTEGLTLLMVDQFSHISIARQLADSKTPGMSQLGFWPPLLHILLAPFVTNDWLYETGLAGAVVLVPTLAVTSVFFYHLLTLLTANRIISLIATALFIFNPYVLYFTATPMMDVLYLSFLIIGVYFFVHWWKSDSLISLMLMGLFVGLSPMARFEGFALVSMAGLFIILGLWAKRVSYQKIESVAVLFGLLAMIGVTFILVYGLIFEGNPIAFINDEWSADDQNAVYGMETRGNFDLTLLYISHVTGYMVGWTVFALAIVAAIITPLILWKDRLLVFFAASLLLSPFLFDMLAMYQGSAIVQVPELPPFDNVFFNERYGINFYPFALAVIAVLAATLYRASWRKHVLFVPAGFFASAVVMMIASIGTFTLMNDALASEYDVFQRSRQISPEAHYTTGIALKEKYDGGNVLITRALLNEVVVQSDVPMKNFITEANEFYYDQANEYPWLYARYVVMFSRDIEIGDWFTEREAISSKWLYDDRFDYYYEQIHDTKIVDLYRLRESRVRALAHDYNISPEQIPSLDRNAPSWEVEDSHEQLAAVFDEEIQAPPIAQNN